MSGLATTQISTPTPIDIADSVLTLLARRRGAAILIEPGPPRHAITLEAQTNRVLTTLPAEIGDAVVARLAIIAGLDLLSAQGSGRLTVRVGGEEMRLLVSFWTNPSGLSLELRRAFTATDLRMGPVIPVRNGDQIGAYRVFEEIGRGGTGVVYRAEHEALGREMALKVLHARLANDPETCARFFREARAASRVRHSGVVDVTDFGTLPDGRAYLVMELVHGPTLEAIIEGGPLAPPRAVAIALRLAEALASAHRAQVIHRDLKPANVFLVSPVDPAQPNVKICDFGAAKMVDVPAAPGETVEGRVFGTPYYMSPEHASGRATDGRTDLYALGCVLYEMIVGDVPFHGETATDVLTHHVTTPPPVPVSPFGELPDTLEACIMRALKKRPDERYHTAEEMARDLRKVQEALSRTGWRKWLP